MLFFTDDLFLKHDTGKSHPENAYRLDSIMNLLISQSWFHELKMLPQRVARSEEICLNHTQKHFESIKNAWINKKYLVDADTHISQNSFDAAMLAAGSGICAAETILNGNANQALLLLRPPGHHARPDQAMGFCLFNNIAICANYLLGRGIKKIAILDWDVHHGNGTEDSFYENPDVLFISVHQSPCYPGSGDSDQQGSGDGLGFNLNFPLPPGSSDEDYKKLFVNSIVPEIEKYKPEFLLISAGFDAHKDDPLAQMNLTSGFYEWATYKVLKAAKPTTSSRVISFLEGGYNLEALAQSVELHTAAMLTFESIK